MNPQNKKEDTSIYPNNKDWVDYTVDIHDGWADDVALVYPDGGWKPEEGELTTLDLETDGTSFGKSPEGYADAENSPTAAEIIQQSQTAVKPKTHYFRTFLIIWLGLLAIAIAFALGYFYDFLDSYEIAYQTSLPYHMMDNIM
ncbi:MAG: hypothetical protein K2K17_03405, partial [Lachnospiraceae bacterium]|nr:hypothetical protein [Lachnospiraceae bacterium]